MLQMHFLLPVRQVQCL